MKQTLYKEEQYKKSQWTGGTTTELAIYPETAVYLNRNFIWRLSSATIETEESSFSKLPDYDRILMVLEGQVVLSYEGERVARLAALEQDSFDGAWKTKSFGKITDFNLMVRKGNEGYMDLIFPEKKSQGFKAKETRAQAKEAHGLFCKEGYAVVTVGGDSQMVSAGQLLVLEYDEGEAYDYSVMGEGTLVRAIVLFDDMAGEVGPEIIPAQKATFDDFKACVYLANVQFRWAKFIVKRLKTQWFDEALSASIRKIERFYFPIIIFLIGAMAIAFGGNELGASTAVYFIAFAVWLLVDSVIVTPLIYLAVLPKPVRKHIKDVNQLTPYEEKVRAEQLGENEQLNRVMKKYKNSGRNLGK